MMRFAEDMLEQLRYGDGETRQLHIWQGEMVETVLIAIHGGMAHGGDWVNVGRYFRQFGYATVAPDLHGHDKKKRIYIPSFDIFLDDLATVIDWAKERYRDKPIFLVGHSMGSLILTHYGLRRLKHADDIIKGVVLSSPYYVNAIKIPALLQSLSAVISAVAPTMKMPIDDFTEQLTHDEVITERHKADAADDLRATEVSARFARELLVAQSFIPEEIGNWSHQLLAFIAGNDMLADAKASEVLLAQIDAQLVTVYTYPDNYHENFNENNREELFAIIHDWIKERLTRDD